MKKVVKNGNHTYFSSQSKEAFMLQMKDFAKKSCFENDLMFEFSNDGFSVGLERAGHSGGYWYDATLTEETGSLKIEGEIVYHGPEGEPTVGEKIGMGIISVILAIPICFIWLICLFVGLFQKKRKTKEQRLDSFMTDEMGYKKSLAN